MADVSISLNISDKKLVKFSIIGASFSCTVLINGFSKVPNIPNIPNFVTRPPIALVSPPIAPSPILAAPMPIPFLRLPPPKSFTLSLRPFLPVSSSPLKNVIAFFNPVFSRKPSLIPLKKPFFAFSSGAPSFLFSASSRFSCAFVKSLDTSVKFLNALLSSLPSPALLANNSLSFSISPPASTSI